MDECEQIRNAILSILGSRTHGKTICPSDAARAVFDGEVWREQMPLVREVAADMESEGLIEICQGGQVVEMKTVKGPIRLRLT